VALQALVSGVPRNSLILLDLYAEVFPLWKRKNSFFGAPFILHNFGGNIEMYGALKAVAQGPAEAMGAETGKQHFSCTWNLLS
jgi:alpha-N-acetylglucosaminidase